MLAGDRKQCNFGRAAASTAGVMIQMSVLRDILLRCAGDSFFIALS